MIGTVRGVLAWRDSDEVCVEVGGLGYRVTVLPTTSVALGELGDEVYLHVHHHIREDAEVLYGFSTRSERVTFEVLIGTHGVGPALAMAILGVHPPAALARVLVDEDLASIRQRAEHIKADQSELNTEREKLAAAIPDSIIPLYQRLMKTKAGLAIAPMHEGKCGGCHMKLIASTVVAVQTGKELARCEDCGRILYAE